MAADQNVVGERHAGEGHVVLERPHQSARRNCVHLQAVDAFATKRDRSGAWRDDAGNEIEGRGLASAVRPDQSQDLAGAQIERQVLDRRQTTEVFGQTADGDERGCAHVARRAGQRFSRPARPDG